MDTGMGVGMDMGIIGDGRRGVTCMSECRHWCIDVDIGIEDRYRQRGCCMGHRGPLSGVGNEWASAWRHGACLDLGDVWPIAALIETEAGYSSRGRDLVELGLRAAGLEGAVGLAALLERRLKIGPAPREARRGRDGEGAP